MPPTNPQDFDRNDPRPTDQPAPRVTETGITEFGFDDPELRPLPTDKLHYHTPHPDPRPEQHEHSDVPIRPLAIALGSIVAVCLGTFVVLYFLFWSYHGQQKRAEKPRTAVPLAQSEVPGPRLQGVPGFSDNHPTRDMNELRAQYKAEVEGYGRAADSAARIPVERAMELALGRGLFPVAAEPSVGQGAATRPAAGAPTTRAATRRAQTRPAQTQRGPQTRRAPQQQQPASPPPQSPALQPQTQGGDQ